MWSRHEKIIVVKQFTFLVYIYRSQHNLVMIIVQVKQADFQKYNGSSNLRSYLHVTNFAELQMWHFMIISNGLTLGYSL